MRRSTGSLIEASAALVLMLPILITILFVTVEVCQAYIIKEVLEQAAREGARNLAIAYGQNHNITTDTTQQQNILSQIHYGGMVVSVNQFSPPSWQTANQPYTVMLTVTYTSGRNGLSVFPTIDPLNLSGRLNLVGQSTYRLE